MGIFSKLAVKARAGSNGIILGRPVDLEFTCTYQSEFETDSERITINEVTSVQGNTAVGDSRAGGRVTTTILT